MIFSIRHLSFFLLVLIGLSSCDNTLQVTAPFENTAVVYGTLDMGNDTQFFRIGRAYLGQDGPVGGMPHPDSLYYPSIDARVIAVAPNGDIKQTFVLAESNNRPKDSGLFTVQGHRLYSFVFPSDYFTENGGVRQHFTYRLELRLPGNDEVFAYGETPMVNQFRIKKPTPIGIQKMSITATKGYKIEWKQAVNARIYQGYMDFIYMEMPEGHPEDSVRYAVRYEMPTVIGSSLSGGGITASTTINYHDYFTFLAESIPVKLDTLRWFRHIDIHMVAGSDDLATYIKTTQPSNSILQDPPFFTNVIHGAGVVASTQHLYRPYIGISTSSADSLIFGKLTCALRFARASSLDTLTCN